MESRYETMLFGIKTEAIFELYHSPEVDSDLPSHVKHPFIQSNRIVVPIVNKVSDIFKDTSAVPTFCNYLENQILDAKNVFHIFTLIVPSYRLWFFKLTNKYLSREDFKEMLLYSWTTSDIHTCYGNVTKPEILEWFTELNYIAPFSSTVTIYCGTCKNAEKDEISWTLNKDIAIWYAKRYKDGAIYKAELDSRNILYYIPDRGEEEVIVAPTEIRKIEQITTESV